MQDIYSENAPIHQSMKEQLVSQAVPEREDEDDNIVAPKGFEYRKFQGNNLYPDFTIPITTPTFNMAEVMFHIQRWSNMELISNGENPIIILISVNEILQGDYQELMYLKLRDLSLWLQNVILREGSNVKVLAVIRGIWFDSFIGILNDSFPITISKNCLNVGSSIKTWRDANNLFESMTGNNQYSSNTDFYTKSQLISDHFKNVKII